MEKNNLDKNVTINRKTIYIILSVLIAILITGFYFYFKNRNGHQGIQNKKHPDSSHLKNDSARTPADSAVHAGMEEYEEGSPYGYYRIIDNTISLPGKKLHFGDAVYVDEEKKTGENEEVIYLSDPLNNPNAQSYIISSSSIIDNYLFDDYKENFSLSPFSGLPSEIKKIILKNNFSDSERYAITQNSERAKSTIAYGDFDGDAIKDFCVIMDNNENQISRLLIVCTNKITKQPYIAYAKNYSDKVKIRSFKKDDIEPGDYSSDLADLPFDGIAVKEEDTNLLIMYSPDLQKFVSYQIEN